MKKALKLFFVFTLLSFSSFGQSDVEYAKTLKTMFEVSGSEVAYQTIIKQMFTMFKSQYSGVETNAWNDLEKELSSASMNDLTEMLTPVYLKHMTKEDLEEMIKFYKTPVGKKYAKSTPLIMEESMQVGQQWGMKIGQELDKKMKEKGY